MATSCYSDEDDEWLLQDEYEHRGSPHRGSPNTRSPSRSPASPASAARFQYTPVPTSATPRRERRPDRYDGKTPWRQYEAHFRAIAELNAWTKEEAAIQLASSLRDGACKILVPRPRDQFGNDRHFTLNELISRLERRYGPGELAEGYLLQLKQRRRKPRESLPELAEHISEMVQQAYPEAPPSFAERMGITHFKDALVESELRAAVHRDKPVTLEAAVLAALEAESYMMSEEQREKPKYVRLAEKGDKKDDEMKERLDRLEKNQDDFIKLMKEMTMRAQESRREPTETRVRRCYICGDKRHLKRNCPYQPPMGNARRSAPGIGGWPQAPQAPAQIGPQSYQNPPYNNSNNNQRQYQNQTTPFQSSQTQPRV